MQEKSPAAVTDIDRTQSGDQTSLDEWALEDVDDLAELGFQIEREMEEVRDRLSGMLFKEDCVLSGALEQAERVRNSQARVSQMHEDLEKRHAIDPHGTGGERATPELYSQAIQRREAASEAILHALDDFEEDTNNLTAKLKELSAALDKSSTQEEEDEEFFDAVAERRTAGPGSS